jgi:hypothetical protein
MNAFDIRPFSGFEHRPAITRLVTMAEQKADAPAKPDDLFDDAPFPTLHLLPEELVLRQEGFLSQRNQVRVTEYALEQ